MKITKRNFKFWYYRVSHGELLVRSPKDSNNNTNLDIVVTDVKYVDLPKLLPNLEIHEANDDDMIYLKSRIGDKLEGNEIAVLVTEQKRFYIVATFIKIQENELDIFDLPFSKLGL